MSLLLNLLFVVFGMQSVAHAHTDPTTEPTTTTYSECGPFELSDPEGTFTSPRYPGNYFNNLNCTWIITAKKGEKIEVNVSDINIEFEGECDFDALEIYDGPNQNAPLLEQICHTGRNSSIIRSSGRNLFVLFRTDRSEVRTGFTAFYQATTCFNLRELKVGGDVEWFKFKDKPKTSAANMNEALLGSSSTPYKGKSKKDVTFIIEAKTGENFTMQLASLQTRYVKNILFTFTIVDRDAPDSSAQKEEVALEQIKNSKKWTKTSISKDDKKIIMLTIKLTWDSELTKKSQKKIQVEDLHVQACLDDLN